MNAVFVGEGAIARRLSSHAPSGTVLRTFSARALAEKPDTRAEMLSAAESADFIVYLAYHHRDQAFNLALLDSVLSRLERAQWKGTLVFLNTQSALSKDVLVGDIDSPLFPSPYRTTKRKQARRLERVGANLRVVDAYLPMVVGNDMNWERTFSRMALHDELALPNAGRNLFATVDVDRLSQWIWAQRAGQDRGVHRRFVLDEVAPIRELVARRRPAALGEQKVSDLRHRYRFASSPRANLTIAIRASILGRLISALRRRTSVAQAAPQPQPAARIAGRFAPVGMEYCFYRTSLNVEALPFPIAFASEH